MKEYGVFTWSVKSSRKGGYTVQCNLRFTANNQMSVVVLFVKAEYPVTKMQGKLILWVLKLLKTPFSYLILLLKKNINNIEVHCCGARNPYTVC